MSDNFLFLNDWNGWNVWNDWNEPRLFKILGETETDEVVAVVGLDPVPER